ncbi:MAG TPA: alpha/beta hydrolase-fold protein [Gemmatimonadales bacterium]|nr:alpha/beta hydrolase-fold protein [Gemmatimonadales bacterium]
MRRLFVLLLTLVPTISLAQSPLPITIGETFTMTSKVLGQSRRINVYLPPSYADGRQAYPVLYLLDGGVGEDFLHVMGIASLAVDWRGLREFILVGIENHDSKSRYHDFIFPTAVESDKARAPNAGGSADFRKYLKQELIGEIARRYRVTDERTIMGESAAGMFVLETLLREPSLFTGYIAISPMLWWNNQSLSREAAKLLARRPFPPDRKLYLTIANEGGTMREGVDRVASALKANAPTDMVWIYQPMDHETHATTFHPVALAAVRTFFALQDSLTTH